MGIGRFNEQWREQGPGLLLYASGNLFKGNFKNGQIEGFGKMITKENLTQSGYYSNGILQVEINEEDEMTYDEYDKLVKKVLIKDNFENVFLNRNKLDRIENFMFEYKQEQDKQNKNKMWEKEEIPLDINNPKETILISQVMQSPIENGMNDTPAPTQSNQ